MNCGPTDLQAIYAGAGIPIGRPTDTSLFTAIGASNALLGCVEALGWQIPATVAIDGFGSVGGHLARILPPSHFRITAISTIEGAISNPAGFSHEQLHQRQAEFGDGIVRHLEGTSISNAELLTISADFLVPSARTRTITETVARGIRARAVVPVANAPYRNGAALALHARGVICLPGYLCNAGGVFGSSMADSGIAVGDVERFFESSYRRMIRTLVERCDQRKLSPVVVVDDLATREAEGRTERLQEDSFARKVYKRIAWRFPRTVKKREMWKRCHEALVALEADVSRVGE
jgi:glutamate dehydrogenase (NAD(P)+)